VSLQALRVSTELFQMRGNLNRVQLKDKKTKHGKLLLVHVSPQSTV